MGKRYFCGFLLITALVVAPIGSCVADAQTKEAPTTMAEATSPEAAARAFYQWYIPLVDKGEDPFAQKYQPLLTQYVARSFLKTIDKKRFSADGLQSDAFTRSQDIGEDWASNIAVKDVKMAGDKARLTILLGRADIKPWRLSVSLMQEDGHWKMAAVKGPNER